MKKEKKNNVPTNECESMLTHDHRFPLYDIIDEALSLNLAKLQFHLCEFTLKKKNQPN